MGVGLQGRGWIYLSLLGAILVALNPVNEEHYVDELLDGSYRPPLEIGP